MRRLLALLACGALFLAGCTSMSGREMKVADVKKIKNLATTADDIRRMFGEPQKVEAEGDAKVWRYTFERRVWGGLGTTRQTLQVRIEADGKVNRWKFTDSSNEWGR